MNADINSVTANGSLTVVNNIFTASAGGLNLAGSPGPGFTTLHNDFYGNTTYNYNGVDIGATDLFNNPMFVDAASGDYHLASGSPLINAGDDSYVSPATPTSTAMPASRAPMSTSEPTKFTPVVTTMLTSLSPSPSQAGRYGLTLTVNGTGFVSGAVVHLQRNGLDHDVRLGHAADRHRPRLGSSDGGTGPVTVTTRFGPLQPLTFTITAATTLTSLSPSSVAAGSAAFTLTVMGRTS